MRSVVITQEHLILEQHKNILQYIGQGEQITFEHLVHAKNIPEP